MTGASMRDARPVHVFDLIPVESLARILVLVEVAPVLEARHSRTPRAHPDVTLQSMDSPC